jgi:hypothetical protein
MPAIITHVLTSLIIPVFLSSTNVCRTSVKYQLVAVRVSMNWLELVANIPDTEKATDFYDIIVSFIIYVIVKTDSIWY